MTAAPADLYDVQCDRCHALHPLTSRLRDRSRERGHALACMDRLNNSRRPCPACGAVERWVLRAAPLGMAAVEVRDP